MSDPAGELRTALEPWFYDDAGIIMAFGDKPVQVFTTLPEVDAKSPYLFVAGIFVDDDAAECMDNAMVDLQVDVWSLTDPPGFAEAELIAPAVCAAIKAMVYTGDPSGFSLPNFRVVALESIRTTYLTDPSDGKTVHAVISARLSIDRID